MKPVRIGCSGWNYKDWRGTVYPEGVGPALWLEHYAVMFDTVEVNSTFYRLASPKAVAHWIEQTPPGFLFALKASRYLTHIKRLANLEDGVKRFYDAIEPLVGSPKLGPVVWQLPPNFKRDDERLAGALAGLPAGRHCFEFRHESWFAPDVYALLREHHVALVIGDHPERPFQATELTADWTFVRFHYGARGRRGNYSESELEEWALRTGLGLDTAQMGYVLSAFGWTYAICQIPGGWLVDRVAPRVLFAVLIVAWSIATIMLGFTTSVAGLMAVRMLVGALEAPSYPINNRVVTTWFPERERATAIGFYTSGQFVGLAFLTPVLVWIQSQFGWHMVFIATGVVGVVWGVIWFVLYREPHEFPATNAAEIDLIRRGGGLVDLDRKRETARPFSGADLAHVLSSRKLWGVYFGQFALTSTLWFFLTWFPTYLVQARGMSFVKARFLASLPFLAAFVGVLCSGVLSDAMVRRGASLGMARKVPIVTGLLLSTSVIGANYVSEPALIVGFLALAFFGNGLASITWSLVSALAPERLLGLTGGVFNFIGNLSGITVPIVIGYLARDYGFSAGLAYIALLALLGALSYVFVVGRVERLPDRQLSVSH